MIITKETQIACKEMQNNQKEMPNIQNVTDNDVKKIHNSC